MTAGPNSDELSVMFVDDEPSILDGIARLLRRKYPKWKTQFHASPVDALFAYKRDHRTLDVVVCDINMPRISGLQIMQAIRERTPSIGIISLSGQLDATSLLATGKLADCHLCKPVNIDILCEKILKVYLDRKLHGLADR